MTQQQNKATFSCVSEWVVSASRWHTHPDSDTTTIIQRFVQTDARSTCRLGVHHMTVNHSQSFLNPTMNHGRILTYQSRYTVDQRRSSRTGTVCHQPSKSNIAQTTLHFSAHLHRSIVSYLHEITQSSTVRKRTRTNHGETEQTDNSD